MTVPYAFSAATSAIPLSQLDDNFNTTITLGNTAIQLGNTVTTLNNMTLANVTISSGNVTITNVTVTTANVTTVNATTVIATTANVTTGNVTNLISGNVALTGGAINGTTLGATTAASANVTTLTTSSTVTLNGGTANGVAYLNGSKALTTGSALTFDGTNLGVNCTATNFGANYRTVEARGATTTTSGVFRASSSDSSQKIDFFIDSGVGTLRTDSNHPLAFSINNTEQMRLTSTGLGIGITNPAYKLVVSNAGAAGLEVDPAGVNGGPLLQAYNRSGAAYVQLTYDGLQHIWRTSGSERARITSGGEVYIAGTTDQGAYNLQVNGTGVWGAGAYVNGSDAHLKEEVQDLAPALDVIASLRPVTFRYKEDYSKDQNIQPGFIAQELQQAMQGQAYVDGVVQSGPEYLNVAYQSLVPLLTKAIQELKAEVDSLKAQLKGA